MSKSTTLSLRSTVHAKGILSIFVLFHHINQFLSIFDGTFIDLFLNQLGYLSVAAFLFFSGYGLSEQTQKRDHYTKEMLQKRILPLYLIYWITSLIYLFMMVITQTPIYLSTIIKNFTFGGTVIRNGWYFQCQLIMYIIFYLSYRFGKSHNIRMVLLCCLLSVYIGLCLSLRLEPMWYQTSPCFLLGVLWSNAGNALNKYIHPITISSAVVVFGISFLISKILTDFIWISIILKMISALTFAALNAVFWASQNHHPYALFSALLDSLGKYSAEVYLFHGLSLMLFRGHCMYLENDLLFIVLVVSLTFMLAVIFHALFKSITETVKSHASLPGV